MKKTLETHDAVLRMTRFSEKRKGNRKKELSKKACRKKFIFYSSILTLEFPQDSEPVSFGFASVAHLDYVWFVGDPRLKLIFQRMLCSYGCCFEVWE